MTLNSGSRLGHYEIVESVGAGGMGEVYRARDTKLGREVAIKVLPAEFARDQERLDRFEREARLLAQLNHANIATLHGLEESDGQKFLVMELVEGETLAERIAHGAIPLDEAMPLFVQLADGLESAHDKGIIHRDLKPANIKTGPDGKIKILDFGLAKAFSTDDTVSAEASQSPTLTKGTALGAIMGTAAYMSPEQAKGKTVDTRADVWALGCVMFEMLSGQKAFHGEDVSETLASVLRDEPSWKALPSDCAKLAPILRRCLRKDARRRFHHVGDVRVELEDTSTAPEPSIANSTRRPFVVGAIAGAVFALLIGLASLPARFSSQELTRDPVRFVVDIGPVHPMTDSLFGPSLAIAPDGSAVVFASGNADSLYLKSMQRIGVTPLAGTEFGMQPFFSPNGQWVGFFDRARLRKVPLNGGPVVTIAETERTIRGATWGADDTIVFGLNNGGLMSVSANGGTPSELTTVDPSNDEFNHSWPHFLPGTRTLLFSAGSDDLWHQARIVLMDLETGERRTIHEGGTYPHYVTTGHIVFVTGNDLMAMPFDLDEGNTTGPPRPVVEGVSAWMDRGFAYAAIGRDGSLVYSPGTTTAEARASLVWVTRDGVETPLGEDTRPFAEPRLSPDERRLVVTITETDREIWVYDLARGGQIRLTTNPGEDESPVWTPDGRHITYAATFNGQRVTLQRPADGSGEPTEIAAGQYQHHHLGAWTTDGQVLVLTEGTPATPGDSGDLWLARPDTAELTNPFPSTRFAEAAPTFSPDGQWLLYTSNDSGHSEIYARAVSGDSGKWQVSNAGGTEPYWSRLGTEIFYRNGDAMMAVAVDTDPGVDVGVPQVLFEGNYDRVPWNRRNYEVTDDGQRFLMVKLASDEEASAPQLIVVLDWSSELKRLVPTDE